MVDFLPKESFFNDVRVKVLFGLQQQRAGAAGRVINFVDAGLPVHGELRNQTGHMLRGEDLADGFADVGGVVGNEEFVGIAKEVDVTGIEVAKVQLGHALEHGGQAGVFVFDRIAQAVAGGVEVGKQAFDVALRRIAAGGAFDGGKDGGEIGIQAFVNVGAGGDPGKQLAGIDEIAFGLDGVVFDVRGDDVIGQPGIVDAVVTAFDVNPAKSGMRSFLW